MDAVPEAIGAKVPRTGRAAWYLAAAAVIAIAVAGAAWYFGVFSGMKTGTFGTVFALVEPQRCDLAFSFNGTPATAVLYRADGMARADITWTPVIEDATGAVPALVLHALQRSGTGYVWTDFDVPGNRTAYDPSQTRTLIWNHADTVRYSCAPWESDSATFAVPEIEFTDDSGDTPS